MQNASEIRLSKVIQSMAGLGNVLFFQTKKKAEVLNSELKRIASENKLEYSPRQEKKISLYATQSAVMNRHFTQLRGFKPTEVEVDRAIHFAAFTTVLDDLMDSSGLSFEDTMTWAEDNREHAAILLHLYQQLEELFEESETFVKYFNLTQSSQNESVKQTLKTPLTEEEIFKITYDKGGYSTLASRAVLSHPLSPEETAAIYELGGVYQLLNDTFDTYKDFFVEPIQTIVQRKPDFRYIRKLIVDRYAKFFGMHMDLDFGTSDKWNSYATTSLIIARGMVACDQLERLQGVREVLDISSCSRSELIVDMEKPQNLLKSIQYARRLHLQ